MKKLILFIVLFWSISLLYAQKEKEINKPTFQEACYFDQLIKNNSEIKDRLNLFDELIINEPNIRQTNKSVQNQPQITIPIVVYIVHKNSDIIGSGTNISDTQVISQIDAMNTYFQAYNINFCLATLKGNIPIPNGVNGGVQNTPGIIHYNNSTLSNHNANTDQQNLISSTSGTIISSDNYLRIWVVNSINGLGNNVLGYSMFPNSSPTFDGIVVRYDVFGDNSNCNNCYNLIENYDKGKTLVHEFGHYAGLYHTFEGGCNTQNKPCNEQGDKVCDTPPAAVPNFTCVPTDSCLQDNIQDDILNHMSYGNDNCSDHFSQGQVERIFNILINYRNNLISTSNLIFTGVCGYENLVSADFDANTFSPCVSQQIQFTAVQQNANSYFWDFGDGTTSSVSNPTHNYNTENLYTISLTVNGNTLTYKKIYVTACNPILNSESNWYFSSANMFNFSSGVPVNSTIPATNFCSEAAAMQNDNNGNLLFYTNGIRIWNNNHNVINNNNLLFGNLSSLKGVAIVPNPANSNQYYIFTKAQQGQQNGFRFSIVNANGSNITLIAINQAINVPTFDSGNNGALISNESIGVSQHCNGYWIFTTAFKNNNEYMLVFNLTASGLVFVNEFLIGSLLTGSNFVNYITSIEISPNGNFICLSRQLNPKKNLLTFDKINGIIKDNKILNTLNSSAYEAQFSPNSNIIYFTQNTALYYYNLILNTSNLIDRLDGQIGGIQLGPDNKIYVSKNSKTKLAAINSPDELSLNNDIGFCNYTEFAGPNLDTTLSHCLPNIIDAKINTSFDNTISSYPQNCLTYQFFPNACGENFNWNFGDPDSGTSNTFTGTVATHNFSSEGTYTVTLRDNNNLIINSLSINIGITPPTIVGSAFACAESDNITNNSIELEAGSSVVWAITSGSGIIGLNNQSNVNIEWSSLPGTITASITSSNGCINTISSTISENCCASDLTFTSTETSSEMTYNASNSITTNTNYIINSGSTINLKSGGIIVLGTNSHIKNGASFLATLEDCEGNELVNSIANNQSYKSQYYSTIQRGETNKTEIKNENSLFKTIFIYPNPSSSSVTITSTKIKFKSIIIASIEGRKVYSEQLKETMSHQIDISSFPTGIYIISMQDNNGQTFTEKLIKN